MTEQHVRAMRGTISGGWGDRLLDSRTGQFPWYASCPLLLIDRLCSIGSDPRQLAGIMPRRTSASFESRGVTPAACKTGKMAALRLPHDPGAEPSAALPNQRWRSVVAATGPVTLEHVLTPERRLTELRRHLPQPGDILW